MRSRRPPAPSWIALVSSVWSTRSDARVEKTYRDWSKKGRPPPLPVLFAEFDRESRLAALAERRAAAEAGRLQGHPRRSLR